MMAGLEHYPLITLGRWHGERAGLVSGEPDWDLMRCPHLQKLPAIQWKLQNLARLKKTNTKKFAQQAAELDKRFAFEGR